jgi:hypothetical protein
VPKVHGKQSKVFVNGHHVSSDFDSFDIQISVDMADKSAFQDIQKAYANGMMSATLSLDGLFDDAATAADKYLTDAIGGTGAAIWCLFPEGDAVEKSGYGISGQENTHNVMSTKDDMAKISAGCQADYAERVISLLPLSTKTTSGSGTANNNGAATVDIGGSAYIQATAVTGTVAVKIEHSVNNADWTDLVSFTAVAAIGAQRVAIAGTINQYTKVTYTLDGGESITMQVSLHRNEVNV